MKFSYLAQNRSRSKSKYRYYYQVLNLAITQDIYLHYKDGTKTVLVLKDLMRRKNNYLYELGLLEFALLPEQKDAKVFRGQNIFYFI